MDTIEFDILPQILFSIERDFDHAHTQRGQVNAIFAKSKILKHPRCEGTYSL